MHHMTKRQTIDCIASQANIEPYFTETIVWEQLETENEEFFRAYYVRLAVRDQTVRFNRALSMQAQLMHNGIYNGLQQPRPNGSQQQQQALMHQLHNGNHNGLLQPRPNGSQQQQAMMHQQRNANYNWLQLQQPHSNGSQQHIINGNNGFQHRSNGSQQQQLHQHNIANNASHVVSTMNAARLGREAMQQQQLNSGASSTRSNLQSYAGTPTSHFSSSSNFPESTSPVDDQAESSSAQNPVDPEEVESGDGSTNVSS
ncbi:hypothetical protein C2S51_031824 [Perilla frutescens var. frutescens]|nr:hypothetical protein C2S51_031824 [Perilla frutescens var. frutescens]